MLQHSRILPDPAPLLYTSPTISVSVGFVFRDAKPEVRPGKAGKREGVHVVVFGDRDTRIKRPAEDNGRIVGHIFFSPVVIEAQQQNLFGAGLAPLAVWPERQNEGIGSMLVERGLIECRNAGHRFVVVLGHPEYYPRFGFVPASRFNIKSEYDVRDEAFMALELRKDALQNCAGIAKYQPEFSGV